MYIAPGQDHTAPTGDKVLMSTETSCHLVICCQFQIIDDRSFWKIHRFTFFPYKSIRDQIWPCRKIGQGQPRVIIYINFVELEWVLSPKCYMPSFKIIGFLVLEKKIFMCFYHIWAWRPSWSCDLDHLYKLSFLLLKEAPHTIWLWLAKRFQRRRCLNIVDDNDNGLRSKGIL